jgi:uncharacterized protein (TIGR02145 family)
MFVINTGMIENIKPDRFLKPVRFAISLFISIAFLQSLSAQHISVESFKKLENDMDARVHHAKKDQNGEVAALIKIVTTETGFSFDGGSLGIVATEQKVAEIWVYVPRGAQRITIMHPKLGVLRNFAYPIPIEAATVYEMRLVTGRVETTVIPAELESQWLLITAEPNTALIYLDDNFEATGILQKRMLPGTYTYRIENNLYHTEAGRITVTSDQRAELNVTLKPNFGFIEVKSTPETGARVMIDGDDAGFSTNATSQRLKSGNYTVTVIKEQFQPASRQVTVKDNETTTLTLDMAPNFATVEINLPADATLYINNEQKGRGNWNGRLSAGVYTFEARKDKHRPAKQDMQLQAGDARTIEVEPQPITGSLDVVTIPPQATIKIDGRDYGTTPNTIRNLLIGEYTVTLERQGYATVTKNITVSEGGSTLINETLPAGRQITITSQPAGAELFISDRKVGITPYTGELGFGSHNVKLVNNTKTTEETITIAQGGKSSFTFGVAEFECGKEKLVDKRDGNQYQTMQIGNQCWMKENLKWLPSVNPSANGSNNSAYYYVYGYQGTSVSAAKATTNYQTYGVLYNWPAALNACPDGWHLPTDNEWTVLTDYLGGSSVAGGKMKTTGTTYWNSPNTGATNSSYFSGLPGGYRFYDGSFGSLGSIGDWWSSKEYSSTSALYRNLHYYSADAYRYSSLRALGFSVRCVRD